MEHLRVQQHRASSWGTRTDVVKRYRVAAVHDFVLNALDHCLLNVPQLLRHVITSQCIIVNILLPSDERRAGPRRPRSASA